MAFDKFATGGVLGYKDIKKFFESVGHVPSQKEIDDAIEMVTKSKSRDKTRGTTTCRETDRMERWTG